MKIPRSANSPAKPQAPQVDEQWLQMAAAQMATEAKGKPKE